MKRHISMMVVIEDSQVDNLLSEARQFLVERGATPFALYLHAPGLIIDPIHIWYEGITKEDLE